MKKMEKAEFKKGQNKLFTWVKISTFLILVDKLLKHEAKFCLRKNHLHHCCSSYLGGLTEYCKYPPELKAASGRKRAGRERRGQRLEKMLVQNKQAWIIH